MKLRIWFLTPCAWALALGLSWCLLDTQAAAQCTPPPALHFGEAGSVRYHSGASEVALRGMVEVQVAGHIRAGELQQLNLTLSPAEGNLAASGVRKFRIRYRAGAAAQSAQLCWKDLGQTKKLVIEDLAARADFHQSQAVSHGVARVEFTFVEGGPGRLVVTYQHQRYKKAGSEQPLPPSEVICFATPLAGQRLSFVIAPDNQQLSHAGREPR